MPRRAKVIARSEIARGHSGDFAIRLFFEGGDAGSESPPRLGFWTIGWMSETHIFEEGSVLS